MTAEPRDRQELWPHLLGWLLGAMSTSAVCFLGAGTVSLGCTWDLEVAVWVFSTGVELAGIGAWLSWHRPAFGGPLAFFGGLLLSVLLIIPVAAMLAFFAGPVTGHTEFGGAIRSIPAWTSFIGCFVMINAGWGIAAFLERSLKHPALALGLGLGSTVMGVLFAFAR
ncbi:MAG: hypothetical protein NTW21_24800 [Verrucomicrobia bacterium]|nr:hypothetical protein [Verrucomicrobiota bacterium]